MAEFTGTGAVIFAGANQRVWNIEFNNDGGVKLAGVNQFELSSCLLSVPITATADNDAMDIHDNVAAVTGAFFDGGGFGNDQSDIHNNIVYATHGIINTQTEQIKIRGNTIVVSTGAPSQAIELVVAAGGYDVVVADNTCDGGSIYVEGVDGTGTQYGLVVTGNTVLEPGEQHAIQIVDCHKGSVHHNTVTKVGGVTANTYDGIILSGDSDDNLIDHNVIITASSKLRNGINVSAASCNINKVVGNNLGSGYGNVPIADSGTGTILSYPAHATYGDNFT